MFARLSIAAVARVALLVATPALAQTPTGTILGSVKDAQGAVVPGATVTATNLGTQFSRNAVTDDGRRVRAAAAAGRQLQGRGHHARASRPSRRPASCSRSDATPASTRRSSSARVSETVSVVGDSPLVETASAPLSRTVGQNEVLNLPLVNRDLYTLLSLTGGVTSNDELELARRAGAVDDHQRLGQGADGHRQLPARRRQQHRRPARHRQPGAEPGSGAGIPRPDQRLLGRVRPLFRRRRRRRHEVGHQRLPRRGLRVLPQRESELAALGAARNDRHQGSARSQPVRRRVRRPAREGQDVLLRQLLGPAAGRNLLPQHRGRADRARAGGRLLAVVAQAERPDDRRQPFPGDIIPARTLRHRGEDDSGQVRAAVEPAEQLLRSARGRSDQHRRRRRSSSITSCRVAVAGGELLLSEGASIRSRCRCTGNIPWVDRDFKWTQHNVNVVAHLDAGADRRSTSCASPTCASSAPASTIRRRRSAI